MINVQKIYEKEKIINSKFRQIYNYSDPNIFYKQVLELIVELSELAYETKCFKYWKNDKPSSAEITIAEYADCLMITLSLFDLWDIIIEDLPSVTETDIVQQFIKLNYLASQITIEKDKNLLRNILSNLLNLSDLLGFSEKELEKYCDKKMAKTLDMISEKISKQN